MHRSVRLGNTKLFLAVALVMGMSLPSVGRAQQLFDFVQEDTGDALATLEVLNLPADELSDFGDLSFTTTGLEFFGLSDDFTFERTASDFRITSGGSVDSVSGELLTGPNRRVTDVFLDFITPGGDTGFIEFRIGSTTDVRSRLSRLDIFVTIGGSVFGGAAEGRFLSRVVPEPSSVLLLGWCGVLGVVRRTRRPSA